MKRVAAIVMFVIMAAGGGQRLYSAPRHHAHQTGKQTTKALGQKPYYAHTPSDIIPYRRMIKPYYEGFYDTPQKWYGPGADEPEPKNIRTVRIGWLGPLELPNPLAPYGQQMLHGAQLAIAEANATGGYHGKPFELMIHQDKARWGDSSNAMVKMVTAEKVWGVLGTIESANSHVMMRAALKFPVAIINSATTDQTLMEHRIPFITRVIPDDRQYSYATAWYVFRVKNYRRVALFRLNNRDGRFSVRKLTDAARRLGHPFILDQRFSQGEKDWAAQIRRIQEANPDAVIVWGDAPEAGGIIRQMRQMGLRQPVIGWYRSVSPNLLSIAGTGAEGFVSAYPYNPSSSDRLLKEFQRRYAKRFGVQPDAFAAYAYDGMDMLIHAIRTAGLNRIRITQKLLSLNSYRGVTGMLAFDGARNNVAPIYLAEVRNGQFRYGPATVPREGYRHPPAAAQSPSSSGPTGARRTTRR